MSGSTPNLGLTVYEFSTDDPVQFYTYLQDTSGSTVTSNMQKIDAYPPVVSASMVIISGSLADLTTIVSSLTSGYATPAEVTSGSATDKSVTPYSLAQSSIFGAKGFGIQVVDSALDADTSSGIAYVRIPSSMNGMNLIRAQGYVNTAGTTNATTVQVRNMTKYPASDSLSSAISIASGDTVGTTGTVDTSYDDISTDDQIKIYVTAQSTTKPKGLLVVLEFQLPLP